MIDDIFTGIPFGFLLSFMIGPVFFILLETSITKGFRAALVFDIGVILGDIIFIGIAYFSSYKLIESIKDDPVLFVFGGIIMVAYGIITFVRLRKGNKKIEEEVAIQIIKKNYLSLFVKGFLLNLINIGVLGFWLVVIITIGPKLDLNTSRMILFFMSVIVTYLITDIVKILLAKQLKSKLTLSNILKVKKGISIMVIISGIALISQGIFPKEKQLVKSIFKKIEKRKTDN